MVEQDPSGAADGSDDFVRVASCATPTEADVLRNVLDAAGLTPSVASPAIVLLTAVWYFMAAQLQSKHVLAAHGPAYRRRSVARVAVPVALWELAMGCVLDSFR